MRGWGGGAVSFKPGDKVLVRPRHPNWPDEDTKATVVRAVGERVFVASKTCPGEPFWTDVERVRFDPEFER